MGGIVLNASNIIWLDRGIDKFKRRIDYLESRSNITLEENVEKLIATIIINILDNYMQKVLNSTVELDKDELEIQIINSVKEKLSYCGIVTIQ